MIIKKSPSLQTLGSALAEENRELYDALEGYAMMQQLYNAAIREISTKLEILDEEFHIRYNHNPIHHMESRLKSPTSIAAKLKRKGQPVSVAAAQEHLLDIAGVRVICCYMEDIYKIAEVLLKQDDITLLRKRDYISSPKENGYRSLHLVVQVPVFLSDSRREVPVEIQIRTVAMDFWASLEHQLHYKGEKDMPENLVKELKECAEAIAEIDLKMEKIYRQL